MSGFWRHFHSMLSCRCHSGVCVIYHIKLINISKMHKKFICLLKPFFNLFRTVQDVLKCEQKSASPSSREGLLVLTSHVIRVLQHNSIWHIYIWKFVNDGNLNTLFISWRHFLMPFIQRMESHKRLFLDKDPERNSRYVIFMMFDINS